MYQATVNNQLQFEIDLNTALQNLDLLDLHNGSFHIIQNNQSYNIRIAKTDLETKTVTLSVNGNHYQVALKDKMDLLLEKLGIQKGHSTKLNDLKAPMPGLVLDIQVTPGQQITKGDPLLVLEAMKMENVLKATGDGVIKSIEVTKGQAVEKGSVLIKF